MNVKFKSLVAAAAFIVAGAASAAVVTVAPGAAYKNYLLTGNEQMNFGSTNIAAINAMYIGFQEVAPTTLAYTVSSTLPLRVTSLATRAPVTTLAIENTTDELVSIGLGGGYVMQTAADDVTNAGGSVSLTNFTIDLANKVIRGRLAGQSPNGTTVLDNIPLWRIDTIAGVTKALPAAPGGTSNILTLTGLHLTPEALAAIKSSLQTTDLGGQVLDNISDYGSIQVDMRATIAQLTTCTVDFATKAVRAGQQSNTVTVRNLTTSPATGWAVQWQYANPVIVSSVKNATVTRNDTKTYTAKPLKANTTLTASGSTAFTFNTFYSGTAPAAKVLSATVAGQTCGVSQR